MELTPGLYEVISPVTIRREPRVVEYWEGDGKKRSLVTNAVGNLKVGDQRTIYSIVTDANNATWGRISFVDAAGKAQWICMKSVNREYVEFVTGENKPGPIPDFDFMERLARVEVFLRTIGYKG